MAESLLLNLSFVLTLPQHSGVSSKDLVDVPIHIVRSLTILVYVEQLAFIQPALGDHYLNY